MQQLKALIEDSPVSALLSWALIVVISFVAVTDVLNGAWLWAGFSVTLLILALVPTLLTRDLAVTVSWKALLLATLPLAAQFVESFSDPLTYVSVATMALLVGVQLTTFTEVRMSPWFAISFVVMTTMAVAAVWAVVQYNADLYLGTSYIPGRKELMWDLVGATVAGLATGLLFEFYFRRRDTPSVPTPEGETG